MGVNGVSGGLPTTLVMNRAKARNAPATTDHAMMLGHGCVSCVIDGCDIFAGGAGDYGLVLKEHTGTIVRNCRITGGTKSALYCKAAASPNIHHNVLIANSGTIGVFFVGVGDTGHQNQNITFVDNRLIGRGAVGMLNWLAAADAGGAVCDRNLYDVRGTSGKFGAVNATSGIWTLDALQTAWTGFGVAGNDQHSRVILTHDDRY